MQQGQYGGGLVWLAVLVMMMVVKVMAGQEQQQQGPISCWSCSAYTQDSDCYDLDHDNKTLVRTCSPEEVFCSVNRIWYIVEGDAEVRNFSVNRTCAADCNPSSVMIGDRTKIHSYTSCCTTPFCNVGSSALAQPLASKPLVTVLVASLLVGSWLRSALPVALFLPPG